jgi:hypothetical protein
MHRGLPCSDTTTDSNVRSETHRRSLFSGNWLDGFDFFESGDYTNT